ncbi:DinB family protein [Spirosoma sp.]|uniref:DinB family protein n=1 Tax=Spirosoma sp. TaxID=1899569 RepID=UPI002631EDEC|nr:DinB family protein [Spirosoma sp.]MCX6217409.1 DinB family protein [Spirosoma sp.]
MEAQGINIQDQLREDYAAFIEWANSLSEERFMAQVDGKWSVAEVMQHLYLSARPVARLLAGPRDVLNQWGMPETPPREYDEVASRYKRVLSTGVKAPASMSPRLEDVQIGRSDMVKRFEGVYDDLIRAVEVWPTQELDDYCIPHPVLGKLSVREMLYFTSIHTQHHLGLLKSM